MNYKEAITAWLADDQLKFDISFDGLEWESIHNPEGWPPRYDPKAEYRVVPKRVKVKIASFGDGIAVPIKRIVVDSTEYKYMETLPLFNRWLSDEITINA